MLRTISITVLSVIVVLPFASISYGSEELLKNGSFEAVGRTTEQGVTPAHWSMWESGKKAGEITLESIQIEREGGPNGKPALTVESRYTCFFQNVSSLKAGDQIRLSGWVRDQSKRGSTVSSQLGYLGEKGTYIKMAPVSLKSRSGNQHDGVKEGWTYFEFEATCPQETARGANVIFATDLKQGGRASFADFSLRVTGGDGEQGAGQSVDFVPRYLTAPSQPDFVAAVPKGDASVAYIDFETGTEHQMRLQPGAGDPVARRVRFDGRDSFKLPIGQRVLFELSEDFASKSDHVVVWTEVRHIGVGEAYLEGYPARLAGERALNDRRLVASRPGTTLKRWRGWFMTIDDRPAKEGGAHIVLIKYRATMYVSRIGAKRLTEEQFQDYAAYDQWLNSVSERYTAAAGQIEFVAEASRQLVRSQRLGGDKDARLPDWTRDGLAAAIRSLGEVRSAFAWANEHGRSERLFGGSQDRSRQEATEATLTALLAQVAELRSRLKLDVEQTDKRVSNEAPLIYAVLEHHGAVDWEPMRALDLDGLEVANTHNSIGMITACKSDGSYDFSIFDKTLEAYDKRGYRVAAWVLIGGGPGGWLSPVLPPWFVQKHGEGVFGQDEHGNTVREAMNLWHPAVRKLYRDFFAAFAERYKDDDRVLLYHCLDEAHPNARERLHGYSPAAREAFRDWLRDRHGSVSALNKACGSSYQSFDEIQPPAEAVRRSVVQGGAHVNEFALFFDESWTDFMNNFIDAFRERDSNHILQGMAMYLGTDPTQQRWTAYGVNTGGGTGSHYFEVRLNHTYYGNRYVNDRDTNHLLWWLADEGHYDGVSDNAVRNVYCRNLWQLCMWGAKAAKLYGPYTWPEAGWNMLDDETDYRLIRDSVAVTPVMKEKLTRVWPVLSQTEVAPPPIAIIDNRLSQWLTKFPPRSKQLQWGLYSLLRASHRPSALLPDAVVADGRENLSDFEVVITQHGTHHRGEMTDNLLSWVRDGGTLVLVGPEGLYTPEGQPDGRLMKELFGVSRMEHVPDLSDDEAMFTLNGTEVDLNSAAPAFWRVAEIDPTPETEVLARLKDGSPAVIRSRLGDGEALYCSYGMQADPIGQFFIVRFLEDRLSQRMAWCDDERVELMIREDSAGARYLAMTHYDPEKATSIQVALHGAFPHMLDLTTHKPTPIRSTIEHGLTVFQMDLLPGEGTLIALGEPADAGDARLADQRALLEILSYSAEIDRAKAAGVSITKDEATLAGARSALGAGAIEQVDIEKALNDLRLRMVRGQRQRLVTGMTRAAAKLEKQNGELSPHERARRQTFLALTQKAYREGHVDKVPTYLEELNNPGFLRLRSELEVDLICRRVEKEVRLDGDLSEWAHANGGELPVDSASGQHLPTLPTSSSDHSAQFRSLYDDENLYLAVEVNDDVLLPSGNTEALWEGDAVEVYLNFLDDHGLPDRDTLVPTPAYGPDDIQLIFSADGLACSRVYGNPINHYVPEKRVAARKIRGGYVLEIAIPWKAVPLRPLSGYTIGLNVRAIDNDEKGNIFVSSVVWKRNTDYRYTTGWGRIRLE